MRTIAHISDLHYGKENKIIADSLIEDLYELNPAVVVVSGDITQRARSKEFRKAQEFLKKIDFPTIIIPGNHDVPLYDVVRRTIAPLDKYKKFITDDLSPFFYNDKIAIYGINTARSLTWKAGRISYTQMEEIESVFSAIDDSVFKILITHHPFIPSLGRFPEDIVGRSEEAIEVIGKVGIDLLLAGHLHHGYSGDVRSYYPDTEHSVISAQAGTAISRRFTRKGNGYNIITVDKFEINIEMRQYQQDAFEVHSRVQYFKIHNQWERMDAIGTERLHNFLNNSAA